LSNYDAVFDTLGGENLAQAFSIVKPGGQVVSISGLPNARFAKEYGLPRWKQALFRLVTNRLTRLEKRSQVSYRFLFMWPSGTELATLTQLIEQHQLQPIVDQTFAFQDLNRALTALKLGHTRGKIVVRMA